MFALIIPTYNAGANLGKLLDGVAKQTRQPRYKIIVDSSSTDETLAMARKFDWRIKIIPKHEFNHGRTRQVAWQKIAAKDKEIKYFVYMTQDVLLGNERSLENLLGAFDDESVGAAYGRQLPHNDATAVASLQRKFSYGGTSRRKTIEDAAELGVCAPFLSDAFAAYRLSALSAVGGFPTTDICEDMYVGGKMLLANWAIQYVADATVHHSHEFSLSQNLARYRATGAFHRRNPWLKENFGNSEGTGMKLLQAQLRAAWSEKSPGLLAEFLRDDAVKFFAYRLGYNFG